MKDRIPPSLVPVIQRLVWLPYLVVYRLVGLLQPLRPGFVFLCTRTAALHDNMLEIRRALDDFVSVREFYVKRWSTPWARMVGRFRLVCAMATTEYTLMDDLYALIYALRLRPGTRLIQVWHALGAMKKMGFSRLGLIGGPVQTSLTHRNYTDVIVSSDQMRSHYSEAFGVPLSAVHATGVPRTDLFFDEGRLAEVRQDMYLQYPMMEGKRIILFAPTFRSRPDDSVYYPTEHVNLEILGESLEPKDLLIIRMHPFVKDSLKIPEAYREQILDMGDYPEFNHLLVLADLLVTDYSSAIFDYALLNRPVVFFVPDLGDYDGARGFYYPFEFYTYGPVVSNLSGLVEAIRTPVVNEDLREQFCVRFLNQCDGKATQRFLDRVMGEAGDACLSTHVTHQGLL